MANEVKEKKKLYTDMSITVKNDSKSDIEILVKGEEKTVKVGGNVTATKAEFDPGQLHRISKIKGVNITTDKKDRKQKEAAKE